MKTVSWTLNPGQESDFTATCDPGQKAISGGFDDPQGSALSADTRPTPDGGSWRVYLFDLSSTAGASGSVYAVCLR